jgi:hypothetical protein
MARVTPKDATRPIPAPVARSRFATFAWLGAPFLALAFFSWSTHVRIDRVNYVSGLAGWSGGNSGAKASAAGNEGWVPRLVVPEHNNPSYEWLDQARQMFAQREWRVRHVDYENAPFGHEVFAPSPYRWWLGLIAWVDHSLSGRPPGKCLERAALVADPLLLFLLLAGTAAFAARTFGVLSAAFLSAGLVALFPFAAQYLPGAPDDQGFAKIFSVWSILILMAGLRLLHSGTPDVAFRARRWFLAAGAVGGAGRWVNVREQAPVLAGLALGGLIAAFFGRADPREAPSSPRPVPPWRAWALGGAVTVLAAYLIEFFPSHMGSWELRAVHPLFGLAWLGAGELLARASAWILGSRPRWGVRDLAAVIVAAVAIAGLPLALRLTHSWGFLELESSALRLAQLPDAVTAASFRDWIARDGLSPAALATVLPLLLLGPAIWLLGRRSTAAGSRAALAVVMGAVLVAAGFACFRINWWNGVDATLLLLGVAATATLRQAVYPRVARWAWGIGCALVLIPGVLELWPSGSGARNALSQTEVVGLIERDLAQWLALHAGKDGAVVLATPNETTTLYYYGGFHGLGTLDWENREGLGAAIRIVSASTPEEALELINRRGVTHIIVPSWDAYLDVYAQLGLGKIEGSFMERIHRWILPPWLRPISYLLPTIGGFAGQSVLILEVVDFQDDAVAEGRLAEFFLDSGQLDLAAQAAQNLRRYPGDLGALVARAQIESARGEDEEFGRTVARILTRVAAGADGKLPWDRKASLAVVLAKGQHIDEARAELQKCVAGLDESKLRSLSTTSLYHFLILSRALGVGIPDPRLNELSLELLPSDVRSRFEP